MRVPLSLCGHVQTVLTRESTRFLPAEQRPHRQALPPAARQAEPVGPAPDGRDFVVGASRRAEDVKDAALLRAAEPVRRVAAEPRAVWVEAWQAQVIRPVGLLAEEPPEPIVAVADHFERGHISKARQVVVVKHEVLEASALRLVDPPWGRLVIIEEDDGPVPLRGILYECGGARAGC